MGPKLLQLADLLKHLSRSQALPGQPLAPDWQPPLTPHIHT